MTYLIVEPGRNTTVEPGPFEGRAGPLVAFRICNTRVEPGPLAVDPGRALVEPGRNTTVEPGL
jgi:hypothetical protein